MPVSKIFILSALVLIAGLAYATHIIDGELGSSTCNDVYDAWSSAGIPTIPATDSLYNILCIPNWVTDEYDCSVLSADLLDFLQTIQCHLEACYRDQHFYVLTECVFIPDKPRLHQEQHAEMVYAHIVIT